MFMLPPCLHVSHSLYLLMTYDIMTQPSVCMLTIPTNTLIVIASNSNVSLHVECQSYELSFSVFDSEVMINTIIVTSDE